MDKYMKTNFDFNVMIDCINKMKHMLKNCQIIKNSEDVNEKLEKCIKQKKRKLFVWKHVEHFKYFEKQKRSTVILLLSSVVKD